VDAAVVVRQLAARQVAGGDDRVVVVHLAVVDDARQRQHVQPGHVLGVGLVGRDAAQRGGDPLQGRDLVGGQELRAGAGGGDDGAVGRALVEALGGGQRALRGQAVAAVGLALQAGQVVEQRRACLAFVALDRQHGGVGAGGGVGHGLRPLVLGGAVLLA